MKTIVKQLCCIMLVFPWVAPAWAQPLEPKKEPPAQIVTLSEPGPSAGPPDIKAQSQFAAWWREYRGKVRSVIASRCSGDESADVAGLEDWCRSYTSRAGAPNQYDLEAILASDALTLAAYHARNDELFAPLKQLQGLLREARQKGPVSVSTEGTKATPEAKALARLDSDLKNLDGATKTRRKNEGAAAPTAALLPSIDVEALLQRLFNGLATALEERAQQEAMAYVLYEFEQEICNKPTQQLRYWLPNTCLAAKQGAFGQGLVSMALLRRSVEEDLRRWPGNIAFMAMKQGAGGKYARTAPGVRELVDAMLHGTHPVRALDGFSQKLVTVESTMEEGAERRNVQSAACLSGMPASLLQYRSLVEDASQGLAPEMDEQQKELAILLLSLEKPSCRLVYSASATEHRLQTWARQQENMLTVAKGMKRLATELESIAHTARATPANSTSQSTQAASGGNAGATPEQLARAAALIGQEIITLQQSATLAAQALRQLDIPPEYKQAFFEVEEVLDSTGNELQMLVAILSSDLGTAYQLFLKHQAMPKDESVTTACDASDAVTHDEALVNDSSAAKSWRCEVRPCVCAPNELVKYGGLLVALADAKTANEVRDTILSASAPVGSWRLKQETRERSMLTLGGLVGFGSDYSTLRARGARFQPRLLVPFGVDVTLGQLGAPWLSVFIQGVDLAGYTNFSTSARTAPRVLEAVSPGLSVKAAIPSTPFAVFTGMAYDLDAGGPTPRGGWRANAGLAIDVTLFVLR